MSNKIKKVLVVGGAGYIGGGVTDILLKRGIPFTVYDNLLYEYQYLKPVEFIYGDIRDTKKLAKILPEFSHIIWLAAIVGDAACQMKPFSGGGLIYGLIGAKIASDACKNSLKKGRYDYNFLKENYDNKWKEKLRLPVIQGLMARNFINIFPDWLFDLGTNVGKYFENTVSRITDEDFWFFS